MRKWERERNALILFSYCCITDCKSAIYYNISHYVGQKGLVEMAHLCSRMPVATAGSWNIWGLTRQPSFSFSLCLFLLKASSLPTLDLHTVCWLGMLRLQMWQLRPLREREWKWPISQNEGLRTTAAQPCYITLCWSQQSQRLSFWVGVLSLL